MRIETFLIAVLTFSLFIGGFALIWGDMIHTYSSFDDTGDDLNISGDNFSNTYNKIEEIWKLSNDTKQVVMAAEVNEDTSALETLITGSYKGVKLIFSTFEGTAESMSLTNSILSEIAITLHVPVIFINAAITIITLLLIFGIIYLIRGFKPPND